MAVIRVYGMKQLQEQVESKYAMVRGLSLHYRVPINATPTSDIAIVMVHGLVVSSRYMIPTALELAPDYHVYIPDLPGYGKSDKHVPILNIAELADVLAEWMQAIGVRQAVLLGNSLGCQIIAQFAVRHPENLLKAILVGPTMDRRARTVHQEIGRWLLNCPFEPWHLFPIVIRDYLDIGFRRFVTTFRYGLQDAIEDHLPGIQIPTLVVRGSRDTVVPQRWAEEVKQLLPQGQFVVIEGAAHDVNYNSPRELAHAVRTFIG